MGAVIGIVIFIWILWEIVDWVTPSAHERLTKVLEEIYEDLNSVSEVVKKLPNGFRWTTLLLGNKIDTDIYITAEKKEDINKVLWSKLYDENDYKSGILFRFMLPTAENAPTLDKIAIEWANDYAANICDPRKVRPVFSNLIKKNDKVYLELSIFVPLDGEDVNGIRDEFKDHSRYEVIKHLTLSCFEQCFEFIDVHNEYRGIK